MQSLRFLIQMVLLDHSQVQARRQDLAAGGAINQKGGHIFKIQYWMYAATGGPNLKWGGTDFKWGGREPLALPLATTLVR